MHDCCCESADVADSGLWYGIRHAPRGWRAAPDTGKPLVTSMSMPTDAVTRSLLLVEDDVATRLMISRHLRRSGYEVTAVDAAESIPEAASWDIVVSDVHLPGLNGLELASRLLAAHPTQPIVLITGDPDKALAREALSRGPVSYLVKPFELVELDAAVRQAADRLKTIARPEGIPAASVRGTEAYAGDPDPGEGPAAEFGESLAGRVPTAWLDYVDASSYAGPGHGRRVALLAERLAAALPADALELPAEQLEAAAAYHELGRLVTASAEPIDVAASCAGLLRDLGMPQALVCAVRHMHERWDGNGGPAGLAGWEIPTASLILSVADGVDHYIGAWRQAGATVPEAVDRGIGLVLSQQGTVFSPLLANALRLQRDVLQRLLHTPDAREPRDARDARDEGNSPRAALGLTSIA
jgi:response regulator RpfG family c-di-GMP phosphodiesterase